MKELALSRTIDRGTVHGGKAHHTVLDVRLYAGLPGRPVIDSKAVIFVIIFRYQCTIVAVYVPQGVITHAVCRCEPWVWHAIACASARRPGFPLGGVLEYSHTRLNV